MNDGSYTSCWTLCRPVAGSAWKLKLPDLLAKSLDERKLAYRVGLLVEAPLEPIHSPFV